MARKAPRAPLVLFGLLAVYIVLQFSWWAYLLLKKDRTVLALKAQLRAEGITDLPPTAGEGHAFWMVMGEGSVFLVLVLVGLWIDLPHPETGIHLGAPAGGFPARHQP
ncbi:MAG: hypothetical protein QM724_04980 [Flavobacteriales bacterium]